jgi:hypothetical protein
MGCAGCQKSLNTEVNRRACLRSAAIFLLPDGPEFESLDMNQMVPETGRRRRVCSEGIRGRSACVARSHVGACRMRVPFRAPADKVTRMLPSGGDLEITHFSGSR